MTSLTAHQLKTSPDLEVDVPIERYAVIGDTGTAALVSDEGSIDWLCLPSFDSNPIFGRLLDPEGGHYSVTALDRRSSSRRYLPGTPVLETTITTDHGIASVMDCFAAIPTARKSAELWPFRWLCRRITGIEGTVSFDVEVAPRDSFGRGRWDLRFDGGVVTCRKGGCALFVRSTAPLSIAPGRAATGRIEVEPGEYADVAVAYADRDVGVLPPVGSVFDEALEQTVAVWEAWSDVLRSEGPYRAQVERSAITLKLLTFAPSGAVVAAPTTSLPETLGGDRNWDYRSSWIRDAARSVVALLDRGHPEDAKSFLFWLTNATRLTAPRVSTLYALNGESGPPERSLEGLRGYARSRPVRTGNAAAGQFQLDNWAYLADAALAYATAGRELPDEVWPLVRRHADFAVANWMRPDHGIWEFRDRPRHFVHSKVMCWVAIDRASRLADALGKASPEDRWKAARQEIRSAVLRDGVDRASGSFVRAFDDPVIDASLLELPIVGFVEGTDPRMVATIDRVRRELAWEDLVMRYHVPDGLEGAEGAFLPCSFWLAHALALAERREEAAETFELACSRSNDVGLLPEEIDRETGAFLGNFPQGLSHLSLLAAARALER
jgi:GH15 family glucan-1,4-alpha-glucosidase